MKYSEFLLQVADALNALEERPRFICLILCSEQFDKYPEYKDALYKAVHRKIKQLQKQYNTDIDTLYYLDGEYSSNRTEARKTWLKDLSKYHASRGN